jgi:glycosyltransferase involved in cell wall biosynthesis
MDKFPDYVRRLQQIGVHDQRVHFMGTYHQDQISEVMREIDIVVVPSLWYENSPNVILEALAHQTPVIASNLGGMAELVQHEGNGLLFEPGEPQSLAVQLQRLVAEPALITKLKAGILQIKSLEQEIDELEKLYRQFVKVEVA